MGNQTRRTEIRKITRTVWFYRRNTKNVSTIAFSSPDQNRTIYSILLIARVQKRKLETFIDVNTDQYLSIAYGFNPVSSARHCVCRRRRNFNARISSSIVVRGDRRRDPRRNSATVRQYLRQTPKAVLRENHFALQVPTSGLGVVYNSATLVIVTTTTIIIIMCTRVRVRVGVFTRVAAPSPFSERSRNTFDKRLIRMSFKSSYEFRTLPRYADAVNAQSVPPGNSSHRAAARSEKLTRFFFVPRDPSSL